MWKNPNGHGGVGGGAKDVLQEKRTYSWLKRVYGQICWASGLGATSNWGQVQIPPPGATSNKYGTPAYMIPGQSISKASGGGSTFDDDEDVYVPEIDPNTGQPVLDSNGNYKLKKADPISYPSGKELDDDFTKSRSTKEYPGDGKSSTDQTVYERDNIYAPAAHVVSISVTTAFPNNGEPSKQTGTVTVKSYNGLHVGLPPLQGSMGMKWGYMDFTGAAVRGCGFGGVVNGGSIALDSDGGYTVTVSGYNIASRNQGHRASPTLSDGIVLSIQDANGQTLVGTNVFSRAAVLDQSGRTEKSGGGAPEPPVTDAGGLVAKVPRNFGAVQTSENAKNNKGQFYRYYVSFEEIINGINRSIAKQFGNMQVKLSPKDDGWDGARAKQVNISAYPLKVAYGDMSQFSGKQDTSAFPEGTFEFLGNPGNESIMNVYFNGEYLAKIVAEETNSSMVGGRITKGINVNTLIDRLITEANACCGNAFGGLRCGTSADPTDRNIWLWDPFFDNGKNGGGGFGYCRSAQLSYSTNGDIENQNASLANAPAGAQGGQGTGGGGAAPTGGGLTAAIASVASNPTDEACSGLQGELASTTTNTIKAWPMQLTVTTDGVCAGGDQFQFMGAPGSVPTGPAKVQGEGATKFILQGIDQSVSGGDWTTTFTGTAMVGK